MRIDIVLKNLFRALLTRFYYVWGNLRAGFQGVRLGRGARVSPYATVAGAFYVGNAVIGRDVVLGRGCYVASGTVMSGRFGEYCYVGYGALIGPTDHDPDTLAVMEEAVSRGVIPVVLVRNSLPPVFEGVVWIASNVVVLRGVRVGRGAIVVAGSVVTKDIPPMEMWGGVPARRIRELRRPAVPDASDPGDETGADR